MQLWFLTYGDLLPQELHVLLTGRKTLLGGVKLGREQFFGLGDGVCQHDIRA